MRIPKCDSILLASYLPQNAMLINIAVTNIVKHEVRHVLLNYKMFQFSILTTSFMV